MTLLDEDYTEIFGDGLSGGGGSLKSVCLEKTFEMTFKLNSE